jgi:deferrochelatase/peroxidase EfeB
MESTRRGFLKTSLAGAGASAIGAGAVLADTGTAAAAATASSTVNPVVPFYGEHQAGIDTPAQSYLQFAAFNVVSDSIADLRKLMKTWTQAAAAMSLGHTVGAVQTDRTPPVDTGEAIGLSPAQLTVTFGFGPSLFGSTGSDRFGLAKHKPAALVDLPAFPGDALQPAISGGDISVQVCANDPQVAFHAIHDLIKLGAPIAVPAWLLAGFGRTGNTTTEPLPRNLMGFQDGTENIVVQDPAAFNAFVWAAEPSSPAWMRGGSYQVARRIQIALSLWDQTNLDGQQEAIGRDKVNGTLLKVLPPASHVALTSPKVNNNQRLYRRGYSFLDGVVSGAAAPAVGLMFICYNKDPRKQFIPIQRRIAGHDALSTYLTAIGSSIFACPPGTKSSGFIGQGLLG